MIKLMGKKIFTILRVYLNLCYLDGSYLVAKDNYRSSHDMVYLRNL